MVRFGVAQGEEVVGEFSLWHYWGFQFSGAIIALVMLQAVVANTLAIVFKVRPKRTNTRLDNAGPTVTAGIVVASSALEEVWFRWLLFYLMVPVAAFFNWITFGLEEWLYRTLVFPVADFTTLGFLSPPLGANPWVVGAAMLMANSAFRNGHKYQGPLGYINSWFGGMLLFYAMINYGLGMAILGHIVYNLSVATIAMVRYQLSGKPAWA